MSEQESSMNTSTTGSSAPHAFELCYRSLFSEGRGFSFPCDARGRVDIDGLSERARCNYYFARAAVGREFAIPAVRPSNQH
jgi:hypothetical protein